MTSTYSYSIPREIFDRLPELQQIAIGNLIARSGFPKFIGFDGTFVYYRVDKSVYSKAKFNHVLIAFSPSGKMTTAGIHE